MSRRSNKRYYVPVGGDAYKTASQRFIEKYDLPPLDSMIKSALLGLGVFAASALLMLLTGFRFVSAEAANGTDYRYYGWIYGGRPALGWLCGSDGTNAGVAFWKIYYGDGSVYDGETLQFMRHGKGTQTFRDGSVYTGGFKNDEFDGQGSLVREDGSGYSGSYAEGLYNGKGSLKNPDGSSYTGTFELGEMSGKGKLVYANGDSFEGTFENDMRLEGVYLWASGESIEGKFENNQPSKTERVIYTDASGDTYLAYFKDGELSGKSSYTRPATPEEPDTSVG